MSEVKPELLNAYAKALYRVDARIDFCIGEYSEALEQLHDEWSATHSHFITAFNPESKRTPAEENASRHAKLGSELEAMGVKMVAAAGLDPEGEWPPEPGYLVFNLDPDDVMALGRAYQQNAVVSIEHDAVPRLIVVQ